MVATGKLCILCKGSRNLCGLGRCPLMTKYRLEESIVPKLKKEYFAPATSVFVGHNNYPNVFAGPMQALEAVGPKSARGYFGQTYENIIRHRSSLLRSKFMHNVKYKSRFVREQQELAMAVRPIDTETYFKKKPFFDIKFSNIIQPQGPTGEILRQRVAENIRIKPIIEKVVNDDLRSVEQAGILYSKGEDVYKITTILSSGALGKALAKKMVPTRWSITAVDDLVGKQLIEHVKMLPQLNEYWVFESEYLANHFVILLMPGSWEFENFEAWAPGSTWGQDLMQPYFTGEHEAFTGRKGYAKTQAGGYYAARLGVLEGLNKLHRQAGAVSFREVSEGYVIPLGVWVVRETARSAFKGVAAKFDTRAEALAYVKSRLRLPFENYIKNSKILRQRKLGDWFN